MKVSTSSGPHDLTPEPAHAVLHEGLARAQDLTPEPARAVLHEGPARGRTSPSSSSPP
uniref:Uncharacterized protein n=1 Tax=Neogobius melanostomus TaxID=47308 RepID=A0A8C6WXY6_9GOBI